MVSIITVNYNGFKDTCEMIESLYQFENYPFEVIVVDNASNSNEGQKLQNKYRQIIVVCSDENLGFAGGNNLGYKYAKGEYILYLNNDMIIHAPFLKVFVDMMISIPGAGLMTAKVKYEYDPNIVLFSGYKPLIPILMRNSQLDENGLCDHVCETAFAHGACMLTSRKVIERTGLMTEIYFLFYEELDWSLQIKRAGYTIWYVPEVCVYHKESKSIPRGTPLRNFYLTRSRMLFSRRNTKGIEKILSCSYLLFVAYPLNVIDYLFKTDKQNIIAITRGTWEGLTCPKE